MSPPPGDNPLDSIYPRAPQHAAPEGDVGKKSYAPWHLPRKAWVRFKQWGDETDRLVRELNPADRPIRYLTLPGSELLDIRVIQHICSNRGKELRFLGFNKTMQADSAGTEANISLDEVMRLRGIRPDSAVKGFDILDLATEKSQVTSLVKRFGNFDVINLDICDSVGMNVGADTARYHRALQTLLTHQAKERAEPWLLFLTTRADLQTIPPADIVRYWAAIRQNAQASANFSGRLDGLLGPQAVNFAMNEAAAAAIGQAKLHRLICLGFGKWLLQFMLSAQPRWGAEMLPSACYRVYHNEPDMLSLAFRFTRNFVPPADPAQIVPPAAQAAAEHNEIALAEGLFSHIDGLTDIDRLLHGDAALRGRMIDKSLPLFKSARVPVEPIEQYLEWVAGREPKFN